MASDGCNVEADMCPNGKSCIQNILLSVVCFTYNRESKHISFFKEVKSVGILLLLSGVCRITYNRTVDVINAIQINKLDGS